MNHSVAFNKGGKLITVKGITGNAQLKAIGARRWYKAGMHGNCCAIANLRSSECKQEDHIPHKIQEILEQYASVFQEPKTLPPKRSQDHRIPLYPSATPVNIRPYRHSHEQKREVEKQVAEMLQSALIQKSHSPYASHVLLIKKKRQLMENVCGLQTT